MSDRDSEEVARLERINEKLRASLKLCQAMLRDYKAQMAANSNDPVAFTEREELPDT